MGTKLKSAVIGTGAISKEHLSFLSKSERAHLASVCDLSKASARYAGRRFGADSTYTDYRQMLDDVKPDIVHILTPPHTHKRIAKDCLEAGVHVFCEKPITPTYDEFKELWSFAQSHHRWLIENQNYCFNESILAIEKLVADGTLGEVQEVEVRIALPIRDGGAFADENLPNPIHKMPAGVIHDFLTHLCSMVVRFIPDFERVSAAWSNHGGGDLFRYDDLDAIVIGGSAHARIRFSCHTSPKSFAVTVRGSKGYVETDLFQPHLRCVIPRSGELLSPIINHFMNGCDFIGASFTNFRNKIMQKTVYEGIHRLLDKTYEAVIEDKAPPISFEDIERTHRLINALLLEANRV
ncbi:Gfo/Idh/MocA family oxidoreductase [Brasilonema sp. UFV-L1]|uniref:Gfo/Idh/MocA family protein n=1 Tax=Brasilonema sp. UFV-L1 TaxID=2234130 RepID=UPI00145D7946|nr:Gfo/Idh/MocA family oxidoreductase [Brasilonema sp. UFV-L1]NMG07235.1 gfo/Idh/MocA family oxidoreductase [Brasilonema sp. UFV-L1]